MELFELFGTIGVNGLSQYNSDIDGATAKSNKFAGVLKTGVAAAAKIGAVAITACAAAAAAAGAAVLALTKSAVQSYAEYEQLVGGVETLFGAGGRSLEEYAESVGKSVDDIADEYSKLMLAQDTVLANAAIAYKTAGLSANDYMSTVTAFTASLLQGLEGDTVTAASIADMAIIDMADNANKMGTAMESIQNAYQGFAKQNYMMLDNLKLGYGGTKTEMERLLADAKELTGIEYDISNLADVYSAIHVIQQEMGITGTTAKEASTTITGSLAAMKGAWENMLTGIADDTQDFGALIDGLVSSVSTVADNLLPRIKIAFEGIGQLITSLAPIISESLPVLIESMLPGLMAAAMSVFQAIATALPQFAATLLDNLPIIISTIEQIMSGLMAVLPGMISTIVGVVVSLMPSFVTAVLDSMPAIIDGVMQVVTGITEALPSIIESVASALPTLLPMIINAIISLVVLLCDSLPSMMQPIIDQLPAIIESVLSAILANLPIIITALIDLVLAIVAQTDQIISAIVGEIPYIIESILRSIWDMLPVILVSIGRLVISMGESLGTSVISAVQAIWNIVVGLWNTFGESIKSIATWIYDNVIQHVIDFFQPAVDVIVAIVTTLWSIVRGVWIVASTWFNQSVIQPIIGFFRPIVATVSQFFSDLWTGIKVVWAVVSAWFDSTVIQPIIEFFRPIIESVSGFFSDLWDAIKSVWEQVSSWFDTNVIQPISSFFSGMLDGIVSAIDWCISALNSLPGVNIKAIGGSGATTGGIDGTHAQGLDYVPFDGYIAELHKGEMVVPAAESAALRQGGSYGQSSDEMVRLLRQLVATVQDGASKDTILKINNRELGRAVRGVI